MYYISGAREMKSKKCLLSMILFGIIPLNVFTVIRTSAEANSLNYKIQTKFIVFKNPYYKVKEFYRLEKKGKLTFIGMKPLSNNEHESFNLNVCRNLIGK